MSGIFDMQGKNIIKGGELIAEQKGRVSDSCEFS